MWMARARAAESWMTSLEACGALPDGEAVALPPACGDGVALAEGAGVDGVVGADDAEESALWGA